MPIITVHYTDRNSLPGSLIHDLNESEKEFYIASGKTQASRTILARIKLAEAKKRNVSDLRITKSSIKL